MRVDGVALANDDERLSAGLGAVGVFSGMSVRSSLVQFDFGPKRQRVAVDHVAEAVDDLATDPRRAGEDQIGDDRKRDGDRPIAGRVAPGAGRARSR